MHWECDWDAEGWGLEVWLCWFISWLINLVRNSASKDLHECVRDVWGQGLAWWCSRRENDSVTISLQCCILPNWYLLDAVVGKKTCQNHSQSSNACLLGGRVKNQLFLAWKLLKRPTSVKEKEFRWAARIGQRCIHRLLILHIFEVPTRGSARWRVQSVKASRI